MNRRDCLTRLAAATISVIAPTTRAQRPPLDTIGFLHAGSAKGSTKLSTAFEQGLSEAGYVRDQHVAIDYRWADGQIDRLPALARELTQRGIKVMAVGGSRPARAAAKAAAANTPIVFVSATDPLIEGLVDSLNRPGGNITGVSILSLALEAKRFGLLSELIPDADPITILANPKEPRIDVQLAELRAAATAARKQMQVVNATTEPDLDAAFAKAAQLGARAMLVTADVNYFARRDRVVALAARYKIPAIYEWREFVEAGGLMSYGTSITEGYRQMGRYVGKILQGAKPGDLPVVQAAKFELLINLKTAATLKLKVPNTLLVQADEVIR